MGDSDCRSRLRNAVKSSLYDLLSTDVDSTGSFVENEDCWLADDGPGNGDTLSLTTRKLSTAVSNESIIPL